jgi:DNA-binding CsgD family transcriptional regulator
MTRPHTLDVARPALTRNGNNDSAQGFSSARPTVQTNLTHVDAKLGLSSRMQVAQDAARHD